MSDLPDKFRFIRFRASDGVELLKRMNYMSGTLRHNREWRRFFEMLKSGEAEQYFKRYDFQREFPKYFN
jgi:accessory colonization factor AcfC